jgi:hypothetical protein
LGDLGRRSSEERQARKFVWREGQRGQAFDSARVPPRGDFPILQNYRTSTTLYPANTRRRLFWAARTPNTSTLRPSLPDSVLPPSRPASWSHQHQHQAATASLHLPSLPCLLIHRAQPRCLVGSASATYYRFEGLDVYLACAVIFPTPHDIPLPQIDSSSMRATSSLHFSSWPGQRSDKLSAFAFFSHPLPWPLYWVLQSPSLPSLSSNKNITETRRPKRTCWSPYTSIHRQGHGCPCLTCEFILNSRSSSM